MIGTTDPDGVRRTRLAGARAEPETEMNTTPLTNEEIERRAKRRVDMKMGFYVHALVFVLVNLGLYALGEVGHGVRWQVFPLWGWGLGLAIHGVVTFVSLRGEGLRERMMAEEVERLKSMR